MSKPLSFRLLIVEDFHDDVLLMVAALERVGFQIKYDHVETEESFERCLNSQNYDAILCDHHLPSISSVSILRNLQKSGKKVPFIIVSGIIHEESANELIKLGASDFVMKNNLERLPVVLMNVSKID